MPGPLIHTTLTKARKPITSAANVPLRIHTLDYNRLFSRSRLSQENGVHVLPGVLALKSFQVLVALGTGRDFPVCCNLAWGSEAREFRGVLGDYLTVLVCCILCLVEAWRQDTLTQQRGLGESSRGHTEGSQETGQHAVLFPLIQSPGVLQQTGIQIRTFKFHGNFVRVFHREKKERNRTRLFTVTCIVTHIVTHIIIVR